jgi:CRP/FNR family transcriptional regulator, cyclic AMP receptor protein
MGSAGEIYLELQKIPWFRELKEEHLKKIADMAFVHRFKAGEIFFREGDPQGNIYFVIEGRVALDMFIPHRGKVRFYTAEQGDLVGWSSVTPSIHQRTAGAVAVIDTVAIGMDAAKLNELCEEDHDLGFLFMRRLANDVANRLLVTRLQLMDIFAKPAETKTDEG